MSLIRPTMQENLYQTLYQLEPERMMYYMFVVRIGRSLFMACGYQELVDELDLMIKEIIEKPLNAPFVAIIDAFYNPRFIYSKRAYTKIGDSIDYKQVTRWEIRMRLEYIKDWIYDKATQLSPYIRFTRPSQMIT